MIRRDGINTVGSQREVFRDDAAEAGATSASAGRIAIACWPTCARRARGVRRLPRDARLRRRHLLHSRAQAKTLKPAFAADHFAMGEQEYDWALEEQPAHPDDGGAAVRRSARDRSADPARRWSIWRGRSARAHQWPLPADGERRGPLRLRSALEGLPEVRRGDDRLVSRCRLPPRRLRTQDRALRRAGGLQAGGRRDAARRCGRRSTAPRITRRRRSRTAASAATT